MLIVQLMVQELNKRNVKWAVVAPPRGDLKNLGWRFFLGFVEIYVQGLGLSAIGCYIHDVWHFVKDGPMKYDR